MKLQLRSIIVLLLVFSIVPAMGTGMLALSSKQQDLEKSLDARLTEISRNSALLLRTDLDRFRQILLTSAQNPAYTEILRDPQQRKVWKQEVDRSLLNLTTIFPGMIDEACRIDTAGVELGRVVQGQIARDSALSTQEAASPFFQPTAQLVDGQVHYQTPYISPDTN
jgi:hypothetical protein